jgi:hypothetical protein
MSRVSGRRGSANRFQSIHGLVSLEKYDVVSVTLINKIITKLNNLIETPPKPKSKIGFNAGP